MKHNRMFWGGSGLAYSMFVVISLVESGLYDMVICAVCCAVGIVLMYGALALDAIGLSKEEKERKRKASVYADWEGGFDKEQKPVGAYGKSFHALKIKEQIEIGKVTDEKCPRCGSSTFTKDGFPYADCFGNKCQLWKCSSCKYEEERFA